VSSWGEENVEKGESGATTAFLGGELSIGSFDLMAVNMSFGVAGP
jgi:hypothetical protein